MGMFFEFLELGLLTAFFTRVIWFSENACCVLGAKRPCFMAQFPKNKRACRHALLALKSSVDLKLLPLDLLNEM